MSKIAKVSEKGTGKINVSGHTDNVPIRSPVFPSNWELSAARAATVVRYLALEGVSPSRMVAMGYGEFQPVARNDTIAGKSKNRRVVLLISKSQDIRQGLLK